MGVKRRFNDWNLDIFEQEILLFPTKLHTKQHWIKILYPTSFYTTHTWGSNHCLIGLSSFTLVPNTHRPLRKGQYWSCCWRKSVVLQVNMCWTVTYQAVVFRCRKRLCKCISTQPSFAWFVWFKGTCGGSWTYTILRYCTSETLA